MTLARTPHGCFSAGGDDTWKLGLVMFMAKIGELHKAGTHGDVFAKAKQIFDKNAEKFECDGEVRVPLTYRTFIMTK